MKASTSSLDLQLALAQARALDSNWITRMEGRKEVAKLEARLLASAPDLLAALAGCADALREAGKDFARANPHAVRPNLYELHEKAARAAIAKATGGAE